MGFQINEALSRFSSLETALRTEFIARDDVIRGMMLALLLREHVLIVGPVGTAKSQIAARLCSSIEGATGFWYQLTQFTTPSELMGPISVKGLSEDRYVRHTDGMLPRAHIIFLDEVFRGSSAVLNTLLSIMNERIYFNDGVKHSKLVTLVGTSNTLPTGVDTSALMDRFLFRYHTYRLHPFELEALVVRSGISRSPSYPTLDLSDVVWLHQTIDSVRVADSVSVAVARVSSHWNRLGADISERRVLKAVSAMRAHALLDGRLSVENKDASVLLHIMCKSRDDMRMFVPLLEQYFPSDDITNIKYLMAATEEYVASVRYMEQCRMSKDNSEALLALSHCLSALDTIYGLTGDGPQKKRIADMMSDVNNHVLYYGDQ